MLPRRFLETVCVGAFLILGIGSADAQQAQPSHEEVLRWYKNATRTVVNNVRRDVHPHLTPDQRRVERSIVYLVPDSPEINAFAREEGGRRRIFINVSLVLVTSQLTYAWISEIEFGLTGCFKDYLSYVIDSIDRNNERAASGRSLRDVDPFFKYASENRGPCRNARPERHMRSESAQALERGMMDAALAFLTLHELAHHLLGHVDHKPTLTESRQNEADADAWALQHCLKINVNPYPAIPFFMLFAALDGGDIALERRNTHPLAIRRFLENLKSIADYMEADAPYRAHFGAREATQIAADIRKFIAFAQESGFSTLDEYRRR